MNDYISTIDTNDIVATGEGELAVKTVSDTTLQAWAQGASTSRETKVTSHYSQSDWVYVAINAILSACNSIPLMISLSDDKIVESGPLIDLLYHDPEMSWRKKLEELVGYLALFKSCYIVYEDMVGNRPTKVTIASELHLRPEYKNRELVHWKLMDDWGQQRIVLPDEVYKIVHFNPYKLTPDVSISPVKVGESVITTAALAEKLNQAALTNGGRLGNVIEVPGKMDDKQTLYLQNRFQAMHGGPHNANKALILSGGAKISAIAQTMVDLQMIDLRKFDAATILSIFGVPGEVVGLNSEAQYAHGPAQQRFILNTIVPLLYIIAEAITYGPARRLGVVNSWHNHIESSAFKFYKMPITQYRSYYDAKQKAKNEGDHLYAWFAYEEHPTVKAMMRDSAEQAFKLTNYGVTANQVIRAYDMPFDENEWGDHFWINSGQATAGWMLEQEKNGNALGEPLAEGEPADPDNEGDQEKSFASLEKMLSDYQGQQQKAADQRYWQGWVKSWAGIEKTMSGKIRGYFASQGTSIKKQVKKLLKDYGYEPEKKCLAKAVGDDVVMRIVFDLKTENDKLRVINRTYFTQAAELGSRQIADEVNYEGSVDELAEKVNSSKFIKRKLEVSNIKLTKVNDATKKRVGKLLKDSINSGESLQQITDKIDDVLGGNRKRALVVARTQVSGAVSGGRHQSMKEAGVKKRRWVTSGDVDTVRPDHRKANGQIVKIDEPFNVGSENLMYPGDPSGSPKNIVNCRCVAVPHIDR